MRNAAGRGDLGEVQEQLARGADVNSQDHNGMTALHFAAGENRAEVVRLLLNRGAKLETKTNGGFTALAWAVKWQGGVEVTKTLIELGADVNGGATPGNTPLDLAIIQGKQDLTELLRQHGANTQGQDLMQRMGLLATQPALGAAEPSTPQRMGLSAERTNYVESDNLGTRQDNIQAADAYWTARQFQTAKEPYILYSFPSEQNAREALLELPCIHVSRDSKKLISTETLTFGYYTSGNGSYEAIVAGWGLSTDLFEKARAAFRQFGGKPCGEGELAPGPDSKVRHSPPAERSLWGAMLGSFSAGKRKAESNVQLVKQYIQFNAIGMPCNYLVFKAPNKQAAMTFLRSKPTPQPLCYLIVETPDGNWGRDKDGVYQEAVSSKRNKASVDPIRVTWGVCLTVMVIAVILGVWAVVGDRGSSEIGTELAGGTSTQSQSVETQPTASNGLDKSSEMVEQAAALEPAMPPDPVTLILNDLRRGQLSRPAMQDALQRLTPEVVASSVPQFIDALADEDPVVNRFVFVVLGATSADLSGGRQAVAKLIEPDSRVVDSRSTINNVPSSRAHLLQLLPRFGFSPEECRHILRRLLADGDVRVRDAAAKMLAELSAAERDPGEDAEALLSAIGNSTRERFYDAALYEALTAIAPRAQTQLLSALASQNPTLREVARQELLRLGESQLLDVSTAANFVDDDRTFPTVYAAAVRLRPFPREGIPLLLASLTRSGDSPQPREKIGREVSAALSTLVPDDLRDYLPQFSELLVSTDANTRSAAISALQMCGARAIPILMEHKLSIQKACTLVTAEDQEHFPLLIKALTSEGEDNLTTEMANCASGVFQRLGSEIPSLVPQLVRSFAGKPIDSRGAKRVCAVLQQLGDPAVPALLEAVGDEDESIRYWTLVALRSPNQTRRPTFDALEETLTSLIFEDTSERVTDAAWELWLSIPHPKVATTPSGSKSKTRNVETRDSRAVKSILSIAQKHLKSKDDKRRTRAEAIYREFNDSRFSKFLHP
jgi:HEAT repeat protein